MCIQLGAAGQGCDKRGWSFAGLSEQEEQSVFAAAQSLHEGVIPDSGLRSDEGRENGDFVFYNGARWIAERERKAQQHGNQGDSVGKGGGKLQGGGTCVGADSGRISEGRNRQHL